MADSKISALTSLASGHASGDLLPIVDVSDTTQAASGTTKQTTVANLLANLPGATNANSVSVTGASLTGSNASTLLNLATTWNTTGTPTAIALDVTNTASNASSTLMALKVGGANKFRVGVNGQVYFTQGVYSPQVALWESNLTAISLASTSMVSWGSGAPTINTLDTGIRRYSAGVLALSSNGANTSALLGGGAAVASATALPVPTGRVFHVTGTTTVTSITSTNYQSGAVITMIFDASLTFTHGNNIILAGAADFSATANDTLTMVYDGTNWYEVCRSVN